jgi:hypothetical protein
MDESIGRSSAFSDDFRVDYPSMDEDFLNYLSMLTPHQQQQLDEFVSLSDHTSAQPSTSASLQFEYGNDVLANHYFARRPVSVYEPFMQVNEFSSLPPDFRASCDDSSSDPKYSWEAEDTEYIETLNELCGDFGSELTKDETETPRVTRTIADIHCDAHHCNDVGDFDPASTHLYATVKKPKKHFGNQMIASDVSVSDPPKEKFPKIMTESCYGELNSPHDLMWNRYEQDLVQSMENIIEDGSVQAISSIMTDSSIIDGVSSLNSSIYEQIPSMTSSTGIEMQATMNRSTNSQRKIVKWWDDHLEPGAESTLDLHGLAEEGKVSPSRIYLHENKKREQHETRSVAFDLSQPRERNTFGHSHTLETFLEARRLLQEIWNVSFHRTTGF